MSFSTLKILATVKQEVVMTINKLGFSTLKILATVKLRKDINLYSNVLVPLRF